MKSSQSLVRLCQLTFLLTAFSTTPIHAANSWKAFGRDGFRISVNNEMHTRVVINQIEESGSISAYDLLLDRSKPIGDTMHDVGFMCSSTVENCSQWTRLFSLSEDGEPVFQDPTLRVQKIKSKLGNGFMAFPLCGYTDIAGQYQPYGAQCAAVLTSNGQRTYFFSIILGRNIGCAEPQKCWPNEFRLIKGMLKRLQ